ncbi:Nucleolar complex-associated protein 2-like protein, partial [Drosera capensis]
EKSPCFHLFSFTQPPPPLLSPRRRRRPGLNFFGCKKMVKKAGDSEDRPSNISGKKAGGHKKQLERLQEKDLEFYEFLKEHDKELLEFSDDEIDNESEADLVSEDVQDMEEDDDVQPEITAEKKEENIPKVQSRSKWLNLGVAQFGRIEKVMLFALIEMDGVLRSLLKLPLSGGKKETIMGLGSTKLWKKYNHLLKSYLGNSLHPSKEVYQGIYKAYVMNCRFINPTKLQHLHFLRNCVVELYRVDIPMAYQHALGFIRQLAMILREAPNTKTKLSAFSTEAEFRPLAYPLNQIISGVAQLVPTAQYLPLRLPCVRMLNRISAATDTFIPVSLLLLDMLVMKELNRPPAGGVGNAVDLRASLKWRGLHREGQETFRRQPPDPVCGDIFCKNTKVERFRLQMKELIHQIEANSKFTNEKRGSVSFLPNDPASATFLEDERKAGSSPMSKYVATLRTRAQNRSDSLMESRSKQSKIETDEKKKRRKRKPKTEEPEALDKDIVEDLVLSCDEESKVEDDSPPMKKDGKRQESALNQRRKSVNRDVSDKSAPITKKGKKRKRARKVLS